MAVTASEYSRVGAANQAFDGEAAIPYKYFSLQENTLDGTYHATSRRSYSALNFDGIDDYVDCSSDTALDLTAAITVEVWFKGSLPNVLAAKRNSLPLSLYSWELAVGFGPSSNKKVLLGRVNSNSNVAVGTTPIEVDTWYHLAMTYDKASIKVYVNGNLDGYFSYTDDITLSTGVPVTIGRRFHTGADGFTEGSMYNMRIWNTALTQEQIRANMYADDLEAPSGLVGYWKLNDLQTPVIDYSTNGNNGTIYGARHIVNGLDLVVRAKSYPTDSAIPVAGIFTASGRQICTYGRSWHISVWDKITGDWAVGIDFHGASQVSGAHAIYDVYADNVGQSAAFANTLNALDDSYIVIVTGSHAPDYHSTAMDTAMKRCGASSAKLSWTTRESYILVGQVGSNEGNAIREVLSNMNTADNSGYKWAETRLALSTSYSAGQVGWWGTSLSSVDCTFMSPPWIKWSDVRSIWNISVVGDEQLDEYPVDFTIDFINNGEVIHTETVTDNMLIFWYKNLDMTYDVTDIKLTVSKINKPNRTVKIVSATNSFFRVRQDSATVSSTSSNFASNYASSKDTAYVQTIDQELTANIFREDPVQISTYERGVVIESIHTAMNAPERYVYGKVEITYTDPFNDESIVMSASETGRFTHVQDVADAISEPKFKWFSLHNNKLDGSFHALSGDQTYSVGWWGTHLSDVDGYLDTPPTLTVQFSARSIISLKLTGDSKLNEYPVDFTFNAYNSVDEVIYSRVVTDNTLVDWTAVITPVLGAVKMTVTIHRINKPNAVVKIMEMFTSVKQEYTDEDIVSIDLLEEIGYVTGNLPIGNISSNEIDIELSNIDRRFDLNNTQSSLYGFVGRNRRVRAWLGAEVAGEIEWHPLGVFWTVNWDISRDSLTAKTVARDRLELLRLTDFTTSLVYENWSLYQLFELLLQDAGVLADEYELDTALHDITIPLAWFDRMSHRAALTHLASCAIIQVFCTKDGKIRVNLDLDATNGHIAIFDDDVNIFSAKYPLAVSDQINCVDVSYRQMSTDVPAVVFESDEVLMLAADEVKQVTCQFDRVPIVSMSAPTLDADSGVSVTSYTLYAWGAVLEITNSNSAAAQVQSISITGVGLKHSAQTITVQDDASIRMYGKIKAPPVDHEFIQDSAYANELANKLLQAFTASRHDVTLNNRGDIGILLGDKVLVNDIEQEVSVPYMVTRQRLRWNGFLEATTEGKKL